MEKKVNFVDLTNDEEIINAIESYIEKVIPKDEKLCYFDEKDLN